MCIVVAVCRQTRNVLFHRICPSLSLSRNSDRLTIGPDVAEVTSCVVSNGVVRPRGSGRLGTLCPSIALSVGFWSTFWAVSLSADLSSITVASGRTDHEFSSYPSSIDKRLVALRWARPRRTGQPALVEQGVTWMKATGWTLPSISSTSLIRFSHKCWYWCLCEQCK